MPTLRAIALLLTLTGLASVQAGGLYRLQDAQGRTVYSDTPPVSGASAQRLRPHSAPPPSPPAVTRPALTLYAGACGRYCDSARALLNARRVPYRERDALDDPETLAELERLTGERKLPVLRVGDRTLIGYVDAQWRAALDAAGYAASEAPPGIPESSPASDSSTPPR